MATGINVELKHKSNDMFPNITTLYFDMDGVLADFSKGAEKLGAWVKNEEGKTELDWAPIYEEGEEFWANLEWTPNGKELFTKVYDYVTSKGCQVCILSAVHYKEGIEGKKTWLSHNLPAGRKKIKAYFTKDGNDKAGYITNVGKFADEDCVLIDDFGSNCKFFRENGGQAIKYSGDVNYVLNELKKMFEWDIHEKYIRAKADKVLSEVDCDFASFKKKTLNEDIIGSLSNKVSNLVKKGAKSAKNAILKGYNDKKQKEYLKNSFDLNDINGTNGYTLETDKGIIYLIRNGKSYYFSPIKFLRNVLFKDGKYYIKNNGKILELNDEKFNKFLEFYENKQFFIKCSLEKVVDKEKTNKEDSDENASRVAINDTIKITIDDEEKRKEHFKYLYDFSTLKIVDTYLIGDFKTMSQEEMKKSIFECDPFKPLYKKLQEINSVEENGGIKIYTINNDDENSKNESIKKLKYAFENVDKFQYKCNETKDKDGKNAIFNIFKKGGENYINIYNEERPVIFSDKGLIVAYI